jgi:hypothetical protein
LALSSIDNTASSFTIYTDAPGAVVSPASGTSTGSTNIVNVSVTIPDSLPTSGAYTLTITSDGVDLKIPFTAASDYFTQQYTKGVPLDSRALSFLYNEDVKAFVGYEGVLNDPLSPWTNYPTDPTGGTLIPFAAADPDPYHYQFTGSQMFPFYGFAPASSIWIGSTGVISFAASNGEYTAATLANHFAIPEISALSSLDASLGGTVSVKETADLVAVTYNQVPTGGSATGPKANVQIELFFDGTIQLTYPEVIASNGIVGLSDGGGIPEDFVPSDFTSLNTEGMKTAP